MGKDKYENKGKATRTYDVADKGILWGWEVSGYVCTKAISAGPFLVPFLAWAFGFADESPMVIWSGLGLGVFFLERLNIHLFDNTRSVF